MNTELLQKLWEESTGTSYPNVGKYRYVADYNIESFAKAVIEECMKSSIQSEAEECEYNAYQMIENKFNISDET